jgi:hypothetical protein
MKDALFELFFYGGILLVFSYALAIIQIVCEHKEKKRGAHKNV